MTLEWLGARDRSSFDGRKLRHRDLLSVICRMTAVDVVTSLDIDDTGALLELSRSEIVSLLESGHLWSYDAGAGIRIPTWQLVRDSSSEPVRLLGSSLSAVVAAIPPSASPGLVRRLMTTEDPSLATRADAALTPAEWIARGHSHWPVMAILLRYLTGSSDFANPLLWDSDLIR
ncbi:hypothetical protein [Curtobacterium flaccumfaciens]|uniref:hypothetical protein n=1 Tax=Curtobacterium flaccumfaciens TaxID=2035 RepID=UPI001BDEC5D5|nr:hypothetical protein [Curtobacterium flaccumfaciens]MBT1631646.1 hypothetical protein [Curtobacterium flaccumfaciens pv. oortii]MCX2844158.1 hypothetical protein [Curtobacterium flaccumfaciens pv. oortii]